MSCHRAMLVNSKCRESVRRFKSNMRSEVYCNGQMNRARDEFEGKLSDDQCQCQFRIFFGMTLLFQCTKVD